MSYTDKSLEDAEAAESELPEMELVRDQNTAKDKTTHHCYQVDV